MRYVLLALAVFFLEVSPVWSQEGPSLTEVEALLTQGRIMEARETLENWWTTRFSMASRTDRQRGIWLRGKLTVDPSMAELDYRRLVLEFPGGAYSDDALFRLGLSAEIQGDLREAQEFFERLLRDYPSSPRIPEAESWIRIHSRQIAALPPPSSTPISTPEADTGSEVAVGEEVGDFSIQLGAFRSLERARSLADQLREEGFHPRMVRTPGNDLARVRIGRFPVREPAESLARELESRGYEVTLVVDAGSEEQVGNRSSSR